MRVDWEKHYQPQHYIGPWFDFFDSKNTVKWALDFVQKDLGDLSPGEYVDLQVGIKSFCSLRAGPIFLGSFPQSYVWPDEKLRLFQETLLETFRTFIREEYIEIDVEATKLKAEVFKEGPRKGWSNLSEKTQSNMPSIEQGVRRLVRAFGEIGHFLKECNAPRSRSTKEDHKCGTLFIGKRNQTYCSPSCQNRASTQASRRTIKEKGHRIRGKSYKSTSGGWVPAAVILTPAKGSGETETEVPLPENEYFEAREDADQFAYELAKKFIKEMDVNPSKRGK